MAITKLMNFNHLVNDQGVAVVTVGYGLSLSELNVATVRNTNIQWACLLVNAGRMCYARISSPSGVAAGIATIPVTDFLAGIDPTKVKRFIMGFRLEMVKAPPNPFPALGFTLETPALDGTGNTGYVSGDPIAYKAPANVAASNQYVEVVLDLVKKQLETYVDGALVKTDPVADKYITGFANLKLFIGDRANAMFPDASNTAIVPMAYYDNLYSVVDTGDTTDTQRDRLGAIVVERIPVTAAEGGWTPSTGTALNVINSGSSAPGAQTPNVTSPNGLAPLDLTLDLSGYNSGKKLLGLHASVSPFKAAGETGGLDGSWVTTEGEKNKAAVAVPTPASSSTLLRLAGTLPLGTPPAGAVKLRLTPR